MFSLLKLIIWMAGVLVIAYFMLPYFDYEVNWNYYNERKTACQEEIIQCRKDLIRGGIQGAQDNCDFTCVDPSILIRKKEPIDK